MIAVRRCCFRLDRTTQGACLPVTLGTVVDGIRRFSGGLMGYVFAFAVFWFGYARDVLRSGTDLMCRRSFMYCTQASRIFEQTTQRKLRLDGSL